MNEREDVIRRIMETPDDELEALLAILREEENRAIFFSHICQTIVHP